MSRQTTPSIVFVHGIWADGSSFSKVIPALQSEGHEVIAAQYGLDTLAGDVAAVKATLGHQLPDGHSYGGALITAAGTNPRVAGLVYLAALAPDVDETSQSQQSKYPVTDIFSYVEVADGRVSMRPEGVKCFAGDLSEEEQRLVWAGRGPLYAKSRRHRVAVETKLVHRRRQDRTVQPELERFLAKRMGATTVELASSHLPMLSQSQAVLDVIRAAAKAV
jgi:pimeloyl-ACP methyl ester carboxylesterase